LNWRNLKKRNEITKCILFFTIPFGYNTIISVNLESFTLCKAADPVSPEIINEVKRKKEKDGTRSDNENNLSSFLPLQTIIQKTRKNLQS